MIAPALAAAIGTGAAAAQFSAPLASDWRAAKGAMKRRLLAMTGRQPGRGRRALGALSLAMTLAGGALATYAAQPSSPQKAAPERLPAQVSGVVGSGDQLSLRVVQDHQARILRPGDIYADRWTVESVTATSVTLVKDGQHRQVGLNPTGALASTAPAAPPSQVRVQTSDEQLLAQVLAAGAWDGKTPRPGLTLDETRRWQVLNRKASLAQRDYMEDIANRAKRAGLGAVSFVGGSTVPYQDYLYFLGPDAPEFADLLNKELRARDAAAAAAYERYGPIKISVAAPDLASEGVKNGILYPETAPYPGAQWQPTEGNLPLGAGVLTMRRPNPAAPISVASSQTNPLRIRYQPSGADPNDHSHDVEGPEPPL